MERHKLIDKLQNETNLSYEEAKNVLEKTNWDILDAMLYLEEKGKVQKPSVSIFYTNEHKENYKYSEIISDSKQENKNSNAKKDNTFGGIFEAVCKVIDTYNNIFFQIKRENIEVLRIPSTVIILLSIFTFWIVIPLLIVGLFFDMEFSLSGKGAAVNRINNILKKISVYIKRSKKG